MKLAILFGGESYEHEISIVSAVTLKEKLSRFELTFIFCDQDHTFYAVEPEEMKAKSFSSGRYKKFPKLHPTRGGFEQKGLFKSQRIEMPLLNLIHGGDGEDGTIAALLEFYGIDYIGPRVDASVFSFDKRYTKWLAASLGVKTLSYEVLHASQPRFVETSYPLIVKPVRLGSSIGVSVVKNEEELDYALDVAFEFDETVLIEPFVEGVKEYNLAGYAAGEVLRLSIIEEPQKSEFLDFDKKYMDFSRSERIHRADLDEIDVKLLQRSFETIYRNLFEGALIRCDFFMIEGEVYLNEINPIPGSMANYLFEDFEGAITELMHHLPRRARRRVEYRYLHSISSAKGK